MTPRPATLAAAAALLLAPLTGAAQDASNASTPPGVRQVSNHAGEMAMPMEARGVEVEDALRFEPYQQLEEMFGRDDVVFLMRHGPTDWSKLDAKAVAPGDCLNQRVMSPEGARNMRDLGTLMAANGVLPAEIVVSEWCRNQQTLEHLFEGFDRVDLAISAGMPHRTEPGLNLLLSLQGSKDVTGLHEVVSSWEGRPDRPGPRLVISHYTNIEELTQFRVFEGEILVLDPKRDNYVLGYLRLKSAQPDVGYFADALASPLLAEQEALDMVDRYYAALTSGDETALRSILAEDWVERGASPSTPDRDAGRLFAEVARLSEGLSDVAFTVEDVALADDTITVRGTLTGRHTGTLFGVPATGREVAFGGLALHRVADGAIVESWQMADWTTLMDLITAEE
jgi:predicted ester cyclase/phosphohistidine phosphatase SixA